MTALDAFESARWPTAADYDKPAADNDAEGA